MVVNHTTREENLGDLTGGSNSSQVCPRLLSSELSNRITYSGYLQGSVPGSISSASVGETARDIIDLTRGSRSSQVCPRPQTEARNGIIILVIFRVQLEVLVPPQLLEMV